MTDQRTLKKIIKEQREAIAILENAVRLVDEFKEKMRENWKVEVAELEAKIEAANKALTEKIERWKTAYSMEANDLQWQAANDLEEVKSILFPSKDTATINVNKDSQQVKPA